MMTTVYVNRKTLPECLANATSAYRCKHYKVVQTSSLTLAPQGWSEGTRYSYTAVSLDDGRVCSDERSPLSMGLPTIDIPSRVVIVEHVVSRGKDMGVTFYVNPSDTQGLLPERTSDLSDIEMKVLKVTHSYVSNCRQHESGLDPIQWETIKLALIAKGYLAKNGALTLQGKNAVAN